MVSIARGGNRVRRRTAPGGGGGNRQTALDDGGSRLAAIDLASSSRRGQISAYLRYVISGYVISRTRILIPPHRNVIPASSPIVFSSSSLWRQSLA